MTLVPIPHDTDCELTSCEENCLICEHVFDSFDTVCRVAAPGFELNQNHTPVRSICKSVSQFTNNQGNCVDCPLGCNRCDQGGCLTCPEGKILVHQSNGRRTCEAGCPVGTRQVGNDYKECVPCSEHCSSCISDIFEGSFYEVCSRCDNGLFLLGMFDCVQKCPRGWVADPTLGWCVKCSCECEECDGNRDQCTSCKGNAYLLDGKCVTNSEIQPFAQFETKLFT